MDSVKVEPFVVKFLLDCKKMEEVQLTKDEITSIMLYIRGQSLFSIQI